MDIHITPTQKNVLKEYIAERICHDPLGHAFRLYSLTDKGRIAAEFLLRRYGRETQQKRGISIESRTWHDPQQSTFSVNEMEKSIKKICKSVEVYDDWTFGQKRFIVKNIDIDLDQAIEIENDCDLFIFNYFDNKRSLLRERMWTEIIIWDISQHKKPQES